MKNRSVPIFLILTFNFLLLTSPKGLYADVPVMSSGTAQIRFSVFDGAGSRAVASGTTQYFSACQPASITKLTSGGAPAIYQSYFGQDLIEPSAVTNLSALSPNAGQIQFSWSAPYSDEYPAPGLGDITSGYFRIKTATFTAYEFTHTSFTVSVSTQMTQMATQVYIVTGLTVGVTHYCRIWHSDENFNWSPVSNGATIYLIEVATNPYAPSSLTQFAGSPEVTLNTGSWTNDVTLKLQFSQSDMNTGDKLRFILDLSTYSDFSFIYLSSTSAFVPQGTTNYVTTPLPDSVSWYWQVRSQDDSTNNYLSPYSTAASGGVAFRIDTKVPSAISSLTALAGSLESGVTLRWTSPGDDGTYGDIGSGIYRIKAATYSIQTVDYDSITNNPPYTYQVEVGTTSVSPLSVQTYQVTGLNPGTTYYFAIKFIDKAGNISSWSTLGLPTTNFAPAPDLVPQPPPGVTATSVGKTSIDVTWDLPAPPSYYDDRDKYWLYRATYSFNSITDSLVTHISTITHPGALFNDTGLIQNNTYYYRLKTLDKGNQGNGIFSTALESILSVIASTITASPAIGPVVTLVYDNHSILNLNNYGSIDGIEDADGTVGFNWPKVIGGGTISQYFIEVSTDTGFAVGTVLSSATIPASVSTYSVTTPLSRGRYYYARVRAKNTDDDFGPWTTSDGLYINRKTVNGDLADWTGTFPTSTNTLTLSGGDALWRDARWDNRFDKGDASQLDISSVAITADEYNLYLFFTFFSTVSAGFDGRNFIQIMVDNDNTGTERVFRGRNVIAEDCYVSGKVPWERVVEIVSGNDVMRAEDSAFSNRRYGAYSENNTNYLYEVSIPLSDLGGKDKFLGKTVKFTIATFWNDAGGVGQWAANYPNVVDCVTNSTGTWEEVQDKVIDFYFSITFSTGGIVISINSVLESFTTPPDEPETASSGVSPAPPSALDLILYNMFIDAYENGDSSNDDINDTNDYGGDFQGIINRVSYLNDLGINVAYFGPPTEFGGGIWGFNIDDAYGHETKFGGTSKYIEMVKTLHNHNIEVMVDWVCGQVGSQNSPTAVKHPDFFRKEQFGWGTKQEFAEPRAFWINNMLWYFSICDAFRYDNPKFWNGDAPEYGFGWEAYEFNLALRKISDRWDPQLYIMGEIPSDVEAVNNFTGTKGPMIHGGEDMRSGGYKDNRDAHICSWVRRGNDEQSTATAGQGIKDQQVNWKNQWSINPVMMENHDEKRFVNRGRLDFGASWPYDRPWEQQIGYMTAFTVAGPAILFYGGELGLEGPYNGSDEQLKMAKDGNVRPMPWSRLSDSNWSLVQANIRRTIQAKANFQPLRSDPKNGGWYWPSFTPDTYGDDVMIYRRNWSSDQNVLCMMNRSSYTRTVSNVYTGIASASWKDWLTDDDTFTTDASGILKQSGNANIGVNSHYARILVKGGYDWANVTGTVLNSNGQPVSGAIVDIDRKSHWTTVTTSTGYYSFSGNLKKVLFGDHTLRCWAPGYNIQTATANINTVGNNISFTGTYALTVDNSPPAAPTTLSAQPRDKAAMLFWQPNTESDFQTYLIYRSSTVPIPDGSFPVPIFEVFKTFYYDNNLDGKLDSNNNVYDLLENGTTYYYRIRAVDRNGNKSSFSNQVTVIPRTVKVKFFLDARDFVGVNSANIAGGALGFSKNSWEQVSLNSNGDGTFEREFEFDDTTFLEYKYIVNGIWEGSSTDLFLDGPAQGHNRGELYKYYQSNGVNENDLVPDIEIVDEGDGTMTFTDVWRYYNDRPPRAVSGIQVSAGPNVLTLGWTKNAEPDLSYYQIQCSSWSAGSVSDYTRCGKNEIKLVDVNLINGNTYYYRIRAVDRRNNASAYSSVYSNFPVAADNTAPGAPVGVAVYGAGSNGLSGIEIKWTPNFEGDLAGYNVYRTTYSGFTPASSNKLNSILVRPTSGPSYVDTTANSGVQYYYRIIALDDTGNSSNSSTEKPAKLVPVTFNVDMGGIGPQNVRILSQTQPLDMSGTQSMNYVAASTWSITLGLISGTTLQYQYSYNGTSTKEQDFATASHYREWAVPYSTSTKNDDWEQNPDMINNVKAYPGVNRAYVYWDQNTTGEDLAGYNVYYTTQSGITPDKKANPSVLSYSQPYTVTGLASGLTYYFAVKGADGGSVVLESTAVFVTRAVYLGAIIYVNFGVPYQLNTATSPWADSTKIKLQLAIQSSTDTAVWSSADRANITEGKMDMTPVGNGAWRAVVPLLRGEKYNFLFFAQTTTSPPTGLSSNTEYYDTVPSTGTFAVSTSPVSISPEGGGNFYPCGTNRDARRLIDIPNSLAENSTWYVFANFGSTPTAPTYIQAVPGDGKITLYWSAPYGRSWVNVVNNVPTGGGESMKAADVVAGGVYQIWFANTNPGDINSYSSTATVSGGVFSYTIAGLNNNTTYYFLLRSSDTFKPSPQSTEGNNYSVWSSTVSAFPTANKVPVKIRASADNIDESNTGVRAVLNKVNEQAWQSPGNDRLNNRYEKAVRKKKPYLLQHNKET
ncbi:MAG: alpha-amylase family glycosyl hydrolase [Elusimicrobiota bacterium]